MRLIDADACIDYIRNNNQHAWEALAYAPTIDAVEVVRCKDCKWWSGSANTAHNNHLCRRALDQNVDYWTRGDDFCSYGERKGGDTE